MPHNIFNWMQSHNFNWFFPFILLVYSVFNVFAWNSRCRSFNIFRVQLRPLTVDGGSVLGRWQSRSPFQASSLLARTDSVKIVVRWRESEERSEPEARATGRQWAFRETSSKFESIHLKGCSSVKVPLSAVATVWCLKGFRRDQGVADVDWEKEEGGREMGKQSNGGKTKRINRGIKEILIWSERLLIFFSSGPAMCTKSVIGFETKQHIFKSCWLCVCVCVFFVNVWIYVLCLPHWCHICVCIHSQSCQLEGVSVWFEASG